MLDLSELYAFVQAVEKKGIGAAARALDLPKSSVSRRILALEAALPCSRSVSKSTACSPASAQCAAMDVSGG